MLPAQFFLWKISSNLETTTKHIENLDYIDCRNELDKIYKQNIDGTRKRNETGTNMVESLQNIFLILKIFELHRTQFEIVQKMP